MKNKCEQGFTLIEIILALVVSSILTVMVSIFLTDSFTRGNKSMTNLSSTLAITSVMEKIRTTYKYTPLSVTLENLKDNVGDGTGNPYSNDYGSYNVDYNAYVSCASPASSTNFISTTYDNTPGANNILMITISSPSASGIRATSLFYNEIP